VWLTDIFIGIFLILLFTLSIKYLAVFKNSQLSFSFIYFIFLVKVSLGAFLTYIQINYYHHPLGGDSSAFFNDAKVLYQSFFTFKRDFFNMLFTYQDNNPYFFEKYFKHMYYWSEGMQTSLYNDNRIFIKLNAILMFFSHGNIYLHLLIINFISTYGLVLLFRASVSIVSSKQFRMIAIFFIPTVLFWCSAIHKETFLLFNLSVLFYLYYQFSQNKNKGYLLLLIVCSVLSIFIKPYISLFIVLYFLLSVIFFYFPTFFKTFIVVLITSVFLVGYLFSKHREFEWNPWNPLIKKQTEFGFAATGGYFMFNDKKVIRVELRDSLLLIKAQKDSISVPIGFQYEYWWLNDLESKLYETGSSKLETFTLLNKLPKAGSAFQLNLKINSFYQYCRTILLSEYAVLFKPLFLEAKNMFTYFSSIENAIILLIFILSLYFIIRYSAKSSPNAFLLLLIIGLVFFILGFTVNISGALSRYRAPLMPLLLCILFSFFPFFNNSQKN
jgi:hypothetical protein